MRTTIDLPEELFREVKIEAAKQDTTLKCLMTQLIDSGLRKQPSNHTSPPRRTRPPAVIKRIPEHAQVPALSNRQLHELLEAQELSDVSDS